MLSSHVGPLLLVLCHDSACESPPSSLECYSWFACTGVPLDLTILLVLSQQVLWPLLILIEQSCRIKSVHTQLYWRLRVLRLSFQTWSYYCSVGVSSFSPHRSDWAFSNPKSLTEPIPRPGDPDVPASPRPPQVLSTKLGTRARLSGFHRPRRRS